MSLSDSSAKSSSGIIAANNFRRNVELEILLSSLTMLGLEVQGLDEASWNLKGFSCESHFHGKYQVKNN